jgi:hypothetical protein
MRSSSYLYFTVKPVHPPALKDKYYAGEKGTRDLPSDRDMFHTNYLCESLFPIYLVYNDKELQKLFSGLYI